MLGLLKQLLSALCRLCVLCGSVVNELLETLTAETQRTRREHRAELKTDHHSIERSFDAHLTPLQPQDDLVDAERDQQGVGEGEREVHGEPERAVLFVPEVDVIRPIAFQRAESPSPFDTLPAAIHQPGPCHRSLDVKGKRRHERHRYGQQDQDSGQPSHQSIALPLHAACSYCR